MNKIFTFFLLFICLNTFAQNDFATIYIYRSKAFTIGAQDVQIQINDIPICNLGNGGYLEYKIFDVKRSKFTENLNSEIQKVWKKIIAQTWKQFENKKLHNFDKF